MSATNVNRQKTGQEAAKFCISLIGQHSPLNEGERQLLASITNDIRLAFDLEGAIAPLSMTNGDEAPDVWIW